jgi:hypothetical protein
MEGREDMKLLRNEGLNSWRRIICAANTPIIPCAATKLNSQG